MNLPKERRVEIEASCKECLFSENDVVPFENQAKRKTNIYMFFSIVISHRGTIYEYKPFDSKQIYCTWSWFFILQFRRLVAKFNQRK